MEPIEIKNVGPIEYLSIPVPVGGGLIVLGAKNGSGKSIALEAIHAVATGSGKNRLSSRDGQLRGEVSGFGARITIGKQVRRSGESIALNLDGPSIDVFVDPQIADLEKADLARMKELIGLIGATVDPDRFYRLLGDKAAFEKFVLPSDLESKDPVLVAGRIKRRLQDAARVEEGHRDQALGAAKVSKEAAGNFDQTTLDLVIDVDPFNEQLERAIGAKSTLQAQAQAIDTAITVARNAERELKATEGSYTGPTLEEAQRAFREASSHSLQISADCDEIRARIGDLQKQLERRNTDQVIADNAVISTKERLQAVESYHATTAKWREQIAKANQVPIADSEIDAAVTAVETARALVTEATTKNEKLAEARRQLAKVKQSETLADEHAKKAKQLRDAADGTDTILSEIIADVAGGLRVEADRLVLDTRRGATYLADLSQGEKYRLGFDIVVRAFKKQHPEIAETHMPVLIISQPGFEGLDPDNVLEVARIAHESGVAVYGAQVSDSDTITATVIQPDRA